MQSPSVKFNLMKLAPVAKGSRSVEDILRVIKADDLASRTKTVGSGRVRLEKVAKFKAKKGVPEHWCLDFAKLRDGAGPGKGTETDPLEDLDISANEFFGEEAGAVFFPATGYLITQYNHHGVRPSAMAHYLGHYIDGENNELEMAVTLDSDADARYKAMKHVRRFEVAIDLDKMDAAQKQAGVSLSDAIERAKEMNGARMVIQVSVGTDKNRHLTKAKSFLNRLLSSGAATRAEVAGRATPEGEICPVDLLHQQLVEYVTIAPGTGRRLGWDSRKAALRSVARTWKKRMGHK